MGNGCSKDVWLEQHPDFDWTPEFRKTLITEIKAIPTYGSNTPCVIFVGPISAGKSSLINTILSSETNHIVHKAASGSVQNTMTAKFTRYNGVDELKEEYCLCDTSGILENDKQGFFTNDVVELVRGHIRPGYKFLEHAGISKDDHHYIKNPKNNDKSHCLVIVLSCDMLDQVSKNYVSKVNKTIVHARDEAVPVAICLTKVDRLCANVRNNKRNIFSCDHLKKTFKRISDTFGVPEGLIFPVISYSDQARKYDEIDIIALLALQKMLQLSSDYLQGPDSQSQGDQDTSDDENIQTDRSQTKNSTA